MKKLMWVGICLFFAQALWAQQTLQQFKTKTEPYYLTLEQENVKNFSCKITSGEFINYIKDKVDKADSTFQFPLKFIWLAAGRAYYILQPFPKSFADTTKRVEAIKKVQMLKQLFQGFLMDWQKFGLASPFVDVPDSAFLKTGKDTVTITFHFKDGDIEGDVKKVFTAGGEFIADVWNTNKMTIINYPHYYIGEGKWICRGWDTQIYENGAITTGISTQLDIRKVQGYWMPIEIDILAQTQAHPDRKALTTLYLKNFQFDINIQPILNPTGAKPRPKPAK